MRTRFSGISGNSLARKGLHAVAPFHEGPYEPPGGVGKTLRPSFEQPLARVELFKWT